MLTRYWTTVEEGLVIALDHELVIGHRVKVYCRSVQNIANLIISNAKLVISHGQVVGREIASTTSKASLQPVKTLFQLLFSQPLKELIQLRVLPLRWILIWLCCAS